MTMLNELTNQSSVFTSVSQVTMLGHVIVVRVVEESFAGDASNVETGSSQSSILLNTHCLHAQLSCLDSSNISSWSRPDNNKINIIVSGVVARLK